MTAHIAVPALAPPDLPATLSPAVLTDLLRKELDFKGLVITDALDMGGIAQGFGAGDAAVRALEAGADTLLMPSDPDAAIRAVVSAVESGRISRQRLQESVVRILSAKEKVGLDRKRFADLEGMSDVVDDPEANLKAQEIANRAVTLVRNAGNLVPLAAPERSCYVVISEGRYSTGGQTFAQEVRKRAPHAPIATLDPTMSRQDLDDGVNALRACETYAVAAFASVSANRGTVGLAGDLPHVIETLSATGKPVAMVALGNPYLLRNFPNVAGYLATYSTVPPSEIAAVKALWGEIAITGHLPVSIPGQAKYGEGIQVQPTRPGSRSGASQQARYNLHP
ncbi:Glycoside hydrolase, family 3 domain protein (fragment) [Candidatus Sulfopaludibacter sp. SbA3]